VGSGDAPKERSQPEPPRSRSHTCRLGLSPNLNPTRLPVHPSPPPRPPLQAPSTPSYHRPTRSCSRHRRGARGDDHRRRARAGALVRVLPHGGRRWRRGACGDGGWRGACGSLEMLLCASERASVRGYSRVSQGIVSAKRRARARTKKKDHVPMASYWCSCSALGSSLVSGSGKAEVSGTYGHLRAVSGRSGVGSWRR